MRKSRPWLHDKVAQTVEHVIKALKLAALRRPAAPDNVTASMWRTALIFWMVHSQRKKSIAATPAGALSSRCSCTATLAAFPFGTVEPEDIPALQEYLGYCLIPSTKGQKMLMLIGKGGEGKSRIGVVMNAIFGLNMNTTFHPESREQSFRQSRPGGQAADGGAMIWT